MPRFALRSTGCTTGLVERHRISDVKRERAEAALVTITDNVEFAKGTQRFIEPPASGIEA